MVITHSKATAHGQTSVPQVIRHSAGKFSSTDIHVALFSTPPKTQTLGELKNGIAQHLKAKQKS
jgi:hypothetical protein